MEVAGRIAKTSPFIPYESGKYILIVAGIIGLLTYGVRSKLGLFIICLVIPAFFYDLSGQTSFFDIVNYGFAPIAIGLWISFSQGLLIRKTQFYGLMKMIWLGCLVVLSYCMLKTPNFEEIEFGLNANFSTTGGGASNQVSTILGLGMFLSFLSIVKKLNFGGKRIFDIVIFVGFTFQGLLTFSRGGILVAVVAILAMLYIGDNTSKSLTKQSKSKSFTLLLVSGFVLYGVFEVVNSLTGGNLLLRYQGETEGTIRGSKEVTADHFVTGRLGIFEKDISLWMDHLITGVGCGSSRYLRDIERIGIAPHVEVSRMLAEHGILGLILIIILYVNFPKYVWENNQEKAVMMAVLIIALLTTFHAAMRTFVSPMLIILCCFKVVDDNFEKVKEMLKEKAVVKK